MKIDLTDEWRCYHFGNFYLSSIQQGIQSAHGQTELFNKYCPHIYNDNQVEDTPAIDMLFTWSNLHKTMICLNGGDNTTLTEIRDNICVAENPYPHSVFYESDLSLGGILTNVVVVLPARIYETAEKIRSRKYILNDNGTVVEPHLTNTNVSSECWDGTNSFKLITTLTEIEVVIINTLNSCGLAR